MNGLLYVSRAAWDKKEQKKEQKKKRWRRPGTVQ
jgi:hypothetical protein